MSERPSFQKHVIKQDVDEQIVVILECEGRPTVGMNVGNWHGRRGLQISVDGMGMFSTLLDLKELGPLGDRIAKFCPYCGEELVLVSSKTHFCSDDDEPGPMLKEIIRLREENAKLEAELYELEGKPRR
jgi:hypothetical protein